MRALVLDDEAEIGRFIRRVAEGVGFVVETATAPGDFQASYSTAVPDLVVLDLQLGRHDGIEQLRFLGGKHYPNAVVLVSGFDDRVLSTAARLGRELGLDVRAALKKPLRAAELRAQLEKIGDSQIVLTDERVQAAIRDGELCLEYQPIVTRSDRRVAQIEALVRWNHPTMGRLAPDRFLPLAEQSQNTIDALTDWVLAEACRDGRRLRERGFSLSIAVNVSAANLRSLDFPDRAQAILLSADMHPQQFCVEVTETVASHGLARSMDVLTRLRLKGFELSIDDFGTGYSSLERLQRLPFSSIKIDRSFVADLATSRDSLAIVRSVVGLAQNLELSSVAEGVEDQATATLLEQLGVDAFQGYYFARPMAPTSLPDWLTSWSSAAAAEQQRGLRLIKG